MFWHKRRFQVRISSPLKVAPLNTLLSACRNALLGLCYGPLWYDVELLNLAMDGVGTNERLMTELIMGRPGYEIRWLKIAYAMRNKKDLAERVDGELSKLGIRFGSKSDIQKGEVLLFEVSAVNADEN